jgi:hypothetical protein
MSEMVCRMTFSASLRQPEAAARERATRQNTSARFMCSSGETEPN